MSVFFSIIQSFNTYFDDMYGFKSAIQKMHVSNIIIIKYYNSIKYKILLCNIIFNK